MNVICDIWTTDARRDALRLMPLEQTLLEPLWPPSWLTVVINRLKRFRFDRSDTGASPVRIKRMFIDEGIDAFMIKNGINRRRIVMSLTEDKRAIRTQMAVPTPVQPGSPYIPSYPIAPSAGVEERYWEVTESGLNGLGGYCVACMAESSMYSKGDYARVPLSNKGGEGFLHGKILSAVPIVKESVPYWRIRFKDDFNLDPQVVPDIQMRDVKQSAIHRYEKIAPGYILIYKSEDESDVISLGEAVAWTRRID